MRAVNTISLNGNAWQIEATGCEALGAYFGNWPEVQDFLQRALLALQAVFDNRPANGVRNLSIQVHPLEPF
jgi:hypothetical protein